MPAFEAETKKPLKITDTVNIEVLNHIEECLVLKIRFDLTTKTYFIICAAESYKLQSNLCQLIEQWSTTETIDKV